jgi:hypothetical protein
MNLEEQVVSLELAKRLKELKVKQDSYFFWVNPDCTEKNVTQLLNEEEIFLDPHPDLYFCAFTATELAEMLPPQCSYSKYTDGRSGLKEMGYKVRYYYDEDNGLECLDESLANAMARMLIHLIEKNQEEWQEELLRLAHNEKIRKNIKKLHKTGKFTDNDGNELKLGETVNFEIIGE